MELDRLLYSQLFSFAFIFRVLSVYLAEYFAAKVFGAFVSLIDPPVSIAYLQTPLAPVVELLSHHEKVCDLTLSIISPITVMRSFECIQRFDQVVCYQRCISFHELFNPAL